MSVQDEHGYHDNRDSWHEAQREKLRAMAADPVNQPPHYRAHPSGVECITITEHMGFCLGNAIKYIWRADHKTNAIEDLEKAQWYLTREIAKRKAITQAVETLNSAQKTIGCLQCGKVTVMPSGQPPYRCSHCNQPIPSVP